MPAELPVQSLGGLPQKGTHRPVCDSKEKDVETFCSLSEFSACERCQTDGPWILLFCLSTIQVQPDELQFRVPHQYASAFAGGTFTRSKRVVHAHSPFVLGLSTKAMLIRLLLSVPASWFFLRQVPMSPKKLDWDHQLITLELFVIQLLIVFGPMALSPI